MIDITKLTSADVGKVVVYVPRFGPSEHGVISTWNEKYIFVRYGGTGSMATRPEDLWWLSNRSEG
jgi:hypothetical protein